MEILTGRCAELSIRVNPLDDTYTARVGDQVQTFETLEQAVEWACKIRDQGGGMYEQTK